MSKPRILFVVSSHEKGWYLPEFAHPWHVLSPHCEIFVASPMGGETTVAADSVEQYKDDEICTKFMATQGHLWKNTERLEAFLGNAINCDAIFYIGGYGPMFDLVDDPVSIKLIREFRDESKMIAAVCHGPAALLKVVAPDGTPLLKGHQVTGFSDQDEIAVEQQDNTPFSLQKALDNASGGSYQKAAEALEPKVVASANGKLLTGQNPASAKPLAEEMLSYLRQGALKLA